jgi:flagellar biosynthetic protein FliR
VPIFQPDALLVFLPALFRIGGMLSVGPILRHARLPVTVKAGTALLVTFVIWPTLQRGAVPEVSGFVDLAWLAAGELLCGMLMGLVATIVFHAVEYAGQMVGLSIGLAIVNVLDPVSGAQVSIISRLYGLFALVVFFALDAHHLVLGAVLDSFQVVPIGGSIFTTGLMLHVLDLAGGIFSIGVRIAAPVLAVMILTELAMGLVVRTVPQMNIFIVGFPLKIGLGFFLIGLTLPLLARTLADLFAALDRGLGRILTGM